MKGVSKSSKRLINKIAKGHKRASKRNTRNRARRHHAEVVQKLPEVHIPEENVEDQVSRANGMTEQYELHIPRVGGRHE